MAVQTHQIIEVDCHIDHIDNEIIRSRLYTTIDEDEDTLQAHLSYVADECLAVLKPHGVYKLFNPAICTLPPSYTEPGIKLVGTMAVLRGKSVYDRMRKATHCVMLATTLGSQTNLQDLHDRFSHTIQDEAVLQACLATLIERASDITNAEIIKDAMERDLYTDDFLRPGDGDFPLETLSQIMFYVQAEKRLGIQLQRDKLIPPWSALGVVGMYDKTQKGRRRACGRCKFRDFCSIRAIGMNCHGKKGSFT